MSRTLDQIVRDAIGNQAFDLCKLVAENEALVERVKELEKQLAGSKEASES